MQASLPKTFLPTSDLTRLVNQKLTKMLLTRVKKPSKIWSLLHIATTKRLCVYKDACDIVWFGMVTQVLYEDLSKPHAAQRQVPLAFLAGHFTRSKLQ